MKATDAVWPELTELEAFRRSVNRKLWAGMGGLTAVAIMALGVALVAFARPIPVVVLDGEGRPVLFEDTVTPRLRMENVRVEAFSEAFLERFACVDSLDVAEDFSKALNMMTPRWRRVVLGEPKEAERRAKYKELNLKSRIQKLDLKIAPYNPDDSSAVIYVVATGVLRFTPKMGVLADSPDHQMDQYVYAELALQRVPVARESIHGLLVDYVHVRYFDSAEALEVEVLRAHR